MIYSQPPQGNLVSSLSSYLSKRKVTEKNTKFRITLGISSAVAGVLGADNVGICRLFLHDSAFDPKNGDIEVVQPPCGDHIDTVEAYTAQIKSAEESLEALESKCKCLSVPLPNWLAKFWARPGGDSSTNLATIQSYDRTFGTLVASSGYKIDSSPRTQLIRQCLRSRAKEAFSIWGKTTSWKEYQSRASAHFTSSRLRRNLKLTSSSKPMIDTGVDHEKRLATARAKFQGVADPVEDESVVKISRKTGITFGIAPGVKDGVNLKEE
ncbi:hypothetical protein EYR41_002399 [Orbilia oligospora]|uniref:Uncharacterized protein n=1 Tax=Orbilia oligospora TaxID=2813651 RepID=A0A8H2DN17_ORBOL|nr:hypothetical protein TWF217_002708 [Orbilia oligospora]KAF3290095.1 hypothetical protein TWF132_007292 [Orbilia oligospora]TGJ62419.1 hypothetical protein EYR41_002399 [Orbilia oligospora]